MNDIIKKIPLNKEAVFEIYDGFCFNYVHNNGNLVHQLIFEAQGTFSRVMTFRELINSMEVIFFCEYIVYGHDEPIEIITYKPNEDC